MSRARLSLTDMLTWSSWESHIELLLELVGQVEGWLLRV